MRSEDIHQRILKEFSFEIANLPTYGEVVVSKRQDDNHGSVIKAISAFDNSWRRWYHCLKAKKASKIELGIVISVSKRDLELIQKFVD